MKKSLPAATYLTATLLLVLLTGLTGGAPREEPHAIWEADNPIQPIPASPLGIDIRLHRLKDPPTPETVRLGRWLFFDERLSADGTVSCGTCHRLENAFSEPKPVSTGVHGQTGTRKAPTIVNLSRSLYPSVFWDGGAATLEAQALLPIVNPIEMGNSVEAALETLRSIEGYRKYFEEAFGSREVTPQRVTRAIADYERTRRSGNSPWDRWSAGDASALSDAAQLGRQIFFGRGRCTRCHNAPDFTDDEFHNEGIGWVPETQSFLDEGRFAVSKLGTERGAFKTPTLRDVGLHPPFMHDGSIATLREVVEHYNRGGNPNPYLDPVIEPLDLKEPQLEGLVAFLEALAGEGYRDEAPATFPQ